MKTLTENLKEWRKTRNITNPNTHIYVASIIEELLEIFHNNKDEIKFLQNEIMDLYFDKEPISELNTVDSLKDIKVFSINEVELMGYDDVKTDDEVFQEINSREQDKDQKENWLKNGAVGKWQKNTSQDKDTLYVADYSRYKL